MKTIKKAANAISNFNRIRKYNLFLNYFKPTEKTKILDVGASEKEYQDNANIIEKRYSYPENITVLSVEEYKEFIERYPKVKIVTYKGDSFPFKNKKFDICWCNAVIEHVGDKYKQEYFLKEISRVARSAFVTTPNRFFPFEVHTKIFLLHYLPKKHFDKFLMKTGKSWATGNYMHLLSLREIRNLLVNCNIRNYKIIKNKLFWFTI